MQSDPGSLRFRDWYGASFFETIRALDSYIRLAGTNICFDEWDEDSVAWHLRVGPEGSIPKLVEELNGAFTLAPLFFPRRPVSNLEITLQRFPQRWEVAPSQHATRTRISAVVSQRWR